MKILLAAVVPGELVFRQSGCYWLFLRVGPWPSIDAQMRLGWFRVAPASLASVRPTTEGRSRGREPLRSERPGSEPWLAILRASFSSAVAARLLGDTWPYLVQQLAAPILLGQTRKIWSRSPKSFISSLYLHTPFLITRVGSCQASVNARKSLLSPCFFRKLERIPDVLLGHDRACE